MLRPSTVKVYRKNAAHQPIFITRETAARILRKNRRNATLLNDGAWSLRVPGLSELMLVTWFA
jgi:hypothetical protein